MLPESHSIYMRELADDITPEDILCKSYYDTHLAIFNLRGQLILTQIGLLTNISLWVTQLEDQ